MELNTNQILQHLFYLTLFTLIYTSSAFNNGQESVTRSFSKNYNMSSESTVTISKFILSPLDNETMNDAFHYAICKRLDSEFLSCNITLETWPFAHATFKSHCADFKMNYPEKNDSSMYQTTFRSINGSNKIFLYIFTFFRNDRTRLNQEFNLIDMSKCTNIRKFTTDSVVNEFPKFLNVYKNVIEVGYANEEKCNGKPSCKITYDYEGKEIGKTEPFNIKYLQFDSPSKSVIPVNHQQPGKGYYILERDFNHSLYAVSYVDSSGEGKRQISNWSPENIPYSAFSCAHELYTKCYKDENEDRTVHCAQYDTEKLRMNITIKTPNPVEWLAVRDLSDGGFLLATGSCTSGDDVSKQNQASCKEFRIQRFSADGQGYKALEIDELELLIQLNPRRYQAVISENDNNEFCIFWVSYNDFDDRINDNHNEYYSYNKWCVPTKYTLVLD